MSFSGIRGHQQSAHRMKMMPKKWFAEWEGREMSLKPRCEPMVLFALPHPSRAQTLLLAHAGPAFQACKGWSCSHSDFRFG